MPTTSAEVFDINKYVVLLLVFQKLKHDYARNPTEKVAAEMTACGKRIKALEAQFMSKSDSEVSTTSLASFFEKIADGRLNG